MWKGVRALQPGLLSNRTLKELDLSYCFFGDEEIRLIADSLVGNTTMDVLNISYNAITPVGLDDITRLLESTRLKTIYLHANAVFLDGNATHRFTRALSRHEFLKDLHLNDCGLGDVAIRRIVDGLVGNTIMEALDISFNDITSLGLADITRLLESTQLKMIYFGMNRGVFNDEDATQHFVSTLQHMKSTVQELPGISQSFNDNDSRAATYASIINNSLTRNRYLNHVAALLTPPPPPPPLPQPPTLRNAGTIMMKIYHRATAKFAAAPNNAGASAMFKLFQARPALLEKRLKRPADAVETVSRQQQDYSQYSGNNDSNCGDGTATTSLGGTATTIGGPNKRRRFSLPT